MSTFPRCHCEICAPKSEKFGNRTLPLPTTNRSHLCRNADKFQTSICKTTQSPSNFRTRFSTNLSMKIKSNVSVEVQPKMQLKIEPKTTPRVQPKRIDQRVSSPARSFNSFAKSLKTFDSTPKTVAVKTPIRSRSMQPKLNGFQSKFNQSAPIIVAKSTPISKMTKAAKVSDLKVVSKKLASITDTEPNDNEIERVEDCNVESCIESNDVTEVIVEESAVVKDSPTVCDENSIACNAPVPVPAKPSILFEENTPIQQQAAPKVLVEDETAASEKADDTQMTSSQLKWANEVLDLLNTGSEAKISNKLVTIGLKTAAQIIKCREIRGKFQQIEDLKWKLGWSEKMYQKFRLRNFL